MSFIFNRKKLPAENMSFGDHLDELRKYLIRIILAVTIVSVIVFINKDFLFEDIILAPNEPGFFTNRIMCNLSERFDMPNLCINEKSLDLINIQLAGQFSAHILITIIASIALSYPFIIWQLWLFVKPALYKKERKGVNKFISISTILFLTGVSFAYFIIVPLALNFLGNYSVNESVKNTISLMSYISSVSIIPLTMGIVFQLPILVYFLTKIGWLTPKILQKSRKLVFVIILIVSAIITPPEAFSLIMVAIPLYLLYEISIIIAKWQTKRLIKDTPVTDES